MSLARRRPSLTWRRRSHSIDLTNTFYEGQAAGQPKAQRGHSKEGRTDAPLLTLGLVLDASGFVRRSSVFAGNVTEATTLGAMLESLGASREGVVIMDRSIATKANLAWLRDNGYRYLVVSRDNTRVFDADKAATTVTTASRETERGRLHRTGPPCAMPCDPCSAPQQPSPATTAGPSTCARPRSPTTSRLSSITPWASHHRRATSARPWSDAPSHPHQSAACHSQYSTCSATRNITH